MKTYFFVFLFFCGLIYPSFAAHDDSFAQMNTVHPAMYALAISNLNALETKQGAQLSWKEKQALKIAKKKLLKAERKIKQGKKAKSFGGLIALMIIGLVFIPLGFLFLLPLLVVGALVLALGLVFSIFRGAGRVWW